MYLAGSRLSRDVQVEVSHHPAEVIILDGACQHMLTALLPDRRCLWTIHYGGSGGYMEVGIHGAAAVPPWSATPHSAFSAILSVATQGPHTIYRDVHMALEP